MTFSEKETLKRDHAWDIYGLIGVGRVSCELVGKAVHPTAADCSQSGIT